MLCQQEWTSLLQRNISGMISVLFILVKQPKWPSVWYSGVILFVTWLYRGDPRKLRVEIGSWATSTTAKKNGGHRSSTCFMTGWKAFSGCKTNRVKSKSICCLFVTIIWVFKCYFNYQNPFQATILIVLQ